MGIPIRHGRACPGHPRLCLLQGGKAWMPATSAGMTGGEALHEENGAKHKRRNGGFPFVMAGYSRPKDGVLSPAYVPAIHVFALVMAGLVPAIHVFSLWQGGKTWMPGTRPGMTAERHAQTQRIIQRRQFSTASWPDLFRPSTSLLLSYPALCRASTSSGAIQQARRGWHRKSGSPDFRINRAASRVNPTSA